MHKEHNKTPQCETEKETRMPQNCHNFCSETWKHIQRVRLPTNKRLAAGREGRFAACCSHRPRPVRCVLRLSAHIHANAHTQHSCAELFLFRQTVVELRASERATERVCVDVLVCAHFPSRVLMWRYVLIIIRYLFSSRVWCYWVLIR